MKINREQWKSGRRGLHRMPLKRKSGRSKTKRTWLRKRSLVIIAVIHHPSCWSNMGGGNHCQTLAKKVRDITNAQIIFTSSKMKICMISLKFSFSSEMKSKVVYRLECCGCKSIYVGQTVRQLTTRIEEHRKEDTPVGQQKRQCGSESGKSEFKWKIIEQTSSSIKLLTLEALRKERPAINTRDEFRSRELTLRL